MLFRVAILRVGDRIVDDAFAHHFPVLRDDAIIRQACPERNNPNHESLIYRPRDVVELIIPKGPARFRGLRLVIGSDCPMAR